MFSISILIIDSFLYIMQKGLLLPSSSILPPFHTYCHVYLFNLNRNLVVS